MAGLMKQNGTGQDLNFVDHTVGGATCQDILKQIGDITKTLPTVDEEDPVLLQSGRAFRMPDNTLAVVFWSGHELKMNPDRRCARERRATAARDADGPAPSRLPTEHHRDRTPRRPLQDAGMWARA